MEEGLGVFQIRQGSVAMMMMYGMLLLLHACIIVWWTKQAGCTVAEHKAILHFELACAGQAVSNQRTAKKRLLKVFDGKALLKNTVHADRGTKV
jgi:hypothetical protein